MANCLRSSQAQGKFWDLIPSGCCDDRAGEDTREKHKVTILWGWAPPHLNTRSDTPVLSLRAQQLQSVLKGSSLCGLICHCGGSDCTAFWREATCKTALWGCAFLVEL